jgi:hypothetical protein
MKSIGFKVNTGVDPFFPHPFRTEQISLRSLSAPKIMVAPDAYADMLAIAELSGSDEIGWLGTVQNLGNSTFLIDKVFMVKQEVDGTATRMDEDGLAELFTELAVTDFAACEKMLFWGHVHPGNSTTPSPQDESQMDQFKHNDWFIRGIFGRSGRAEFTLFDYKNGVRWNDCPWQLHCLVSESRKERWQAEVREKVKKSLRTYYPSSGYNYPLTESPNSIIDLTSGIDRGPGRFRKKYLRGK